MKYDTQLSNLKISEDIAKVLKIKGTSNNGEPVDVDKIAKMSFLSETKSTLRLACVDKLIPFENPMPTACFRNNYHHINTSQSTLETIKATTCPYKESSTDS